LVACEDNEERVLGQVELQESLQQLQSDLFSLSSTCVTQEQLAERDVRLQGLEDDFSSLSLQVGQQTMQVADRLQAVQDGLDSLTGNVITSNITWTVGASADAMFSDLFEAMEALKFVEIRPGAIMTLKVEDGVYSANGRTLFLNHPDGSRINIIGNEAHPERVILSFMDIRTGVEVGEGHHLGLLSGFKLLGEPGSTSYGLMVWGLSSVNVDHLVVSHWGHTGVWAGWNANLWVKRSGGLETAYNTQNGLGIHTGSFVHASGVYSHDNGRDGVDINWGAVGWLPGAVFENNDYHGVDTNGVSASNLQAATSLNNGGNGFQIGHGAFGSLMDSHSNTNEANGYHAYYGGLIRGERSSANGNSLWGWSGGANSWMYAVSSTYTGEYGAYNSGTTEDDVGRIIMR